MSNPDLLRSLGSLTRGLSAMFWGLPLGLLLGARTVVHDWIRPLGILPTLLATSLLVYGLLLIGQFQKQERVWQQAVDRAKLFAIALVGLAPFLQWWSLQPNVPLFIQMSTALVLVGVAFLLALNQVLQRLGAMIPHEPLRVETRFFTTLNHQLLIALILLSGIHTVLAHTPLGPLYSRLLETTRSWAVLFLVLLPVALTMTLLWKIKETLLASVFTDRA